MKRLSSGFFHYSLPDTVEAQQKSEALYRLPALRNMGPCAVSVLPRLLHLHLLGSQEVGGVASDY
jgi:hypothetical protein